MTSQTIDIHGAVDAKFEEVREAFARNFEEHNERGAAVSVRVDGERVVDLWGGYADAEGGTGPGSATRSSTSTRRRKA